MASGFMGPELGPYPPDRSLGRFSCSCSGFLFLDSSLIAVLVFSLHASPTGLDSGISPFCICCSTILLNARLYLSGSNLWIAASILSLQPSLCGTLTSPRFAARHPLQPGVYECFSKSDFTMYILLGLASFISGSLISSSPRSFILNLDLIWILP